MNEKEKKAAEDLAIIRARQATCCHEFIKGMSYTQHACVRCGITQSDWDTMQATLPVPAASGQHNWYGIMVCQSSSPYDANGSAIQLVSNRKADPADLTEVELLERIGLALESKS